MTIVVAVLPRERIAGAPLCFNYSETSRDKVGGGQGGKTTNFPNGDVFHRLPKTVCELCVSIVLGTRGSPVHVTPTSLSGSLSTHPPSMCL